MAKRQPLCYNIGMPKKRTWTQNQFIDAVNSSRSILEALTKIGLKPTGGNYKQFHFYVKELGLDTSHFTGQSWIKGRKFVTRQPKQLSEILVVDSTYQSSLLRKRLIAENIFEHKCSRCQLSEWLGQPISLELEHINGTNTDNRLENLTLLCPNCHAQTSTYRGKNKRPRIPTAEEEDLKPSQ